MCELGKQPHSYVSRQVNAHLMSPVSQTDVVAFERDAYFTFQNYNNLGLRISHPDVDAFNSAAEYRFDSVDYLVRAAVTTFLHR
jgi:hypothetical protein